MQELENLNATGREAATKNSLSREEANRLITESEMKNLQAVHKPTV